MTTVPNRSEIDPKYTWNAPSVFADEAAWEAELEAVQADLPELSALQGKIADGAENLVAASKLVTDLAARASTVAFYAFMTFSCDTTDQNAAAMAGKGQNLMGQFSAAASFINPELVAIGEPTLMRWLDETPELAYLKHFVSDLFRQQAHVRSAEVEEVLGMASAAFSGPQSSTSMLTNADFDFAPAIDSAGNEHTVTQGTLDTILTQPDREARRAAWENYHGMYDSFRNTLATNLNASVMQNVFKMRVRKYDSTVGMSLSQYDIPVDVFHNLVATFRKNIPVWHRYFEVRRKALGVDKLQPYDIWAPLTPTNPHVSFEQAVEWICTGLAPLGEEYVETMRKGCLEERWVDVYPNTGKRAGAFSYGTPLTHPFIMMSTDDSLGGLSTLAHELGHSMHTYLSNKNQPFEYSNYSLFVAEVASNFNQAMTRDYLLKHNPDRDFQIGLIDEAMANFYRYFFIMPILAQFELAAHEHVEQGGSLSADYLKTLCADLFSEGFGDGVHVDRDLVGMIWATFGHLYADYYVYQYATGISGAHALSNRILANEPGSAEAYLIYLKSGSSDYPLNVLKRAGVDLTTPAPVEETFAVMESYIDRLEQLTS